MAVYESDGSRNGIRETCANLDRESVVSTLSGLSQKGSEIEIKTLCTRQERKSSQNP